MSIENKNYQLTERGEKLKNASKIAVKYIGGAAVILAVAHGVDRVVESPEFKGSHPVEIGSGETLWDNANDIKGGASHTGAVVEHVKNDPRNEEVAANGIADAGETWIFPDEVDTK